jgi:toxin ParE1/3/4
MMKQLLLAPEAAEELEHIWRFIATESESLEVADRITETISDRFELLALNPYLGRRRDHDLRIGLRTFPVGNYLIVYRIEDDAVLILHVIHGSRRIEALLGD